MVVDLHNVYSTLARRASQEERWWVRPYVRSEADLLERAEEKVAKAAHALFAVSDSDAAYFRACGARNVTVVPNGVDCAAYDALPTGERKGSPLILYLGAMSWMPNVRAAQYLAQEVLPRVASQVPTVRLRIVGRDPTPEVLALRALPGVEVTGTVPDLIPHLRDAHVLAVPLEAGGGTRLKILEAFAAGLPVVSTPVGCEGIDVVAGKHLLIAQRSDFAAAVAAVLLDPSRSHELAAQGRLLVRKVYDWSRVGEIACAAVDSLLQNRQPNDGRERCFSSLSQA
jgi:glycosyltransferase involved in cell wall biosynthesis